MNKIQHKEYLIQYEFIEVLDRVSYNTSVFAIINKDRVLLIDSGYYSHSLEIKKDLMNNGYTVDEIIITHYHRDHAEGSISFPDAIIIASKNYKANIEKCNDLLKVNLKYKVPDIKVNEFYVHYFGGHKIEIVSTPGHTPCSLSLIINDKFLYVSDLLLEDINEKMIIPYIDLNSNPSDHLLSLKKFKTFNFNSLLLTHGKAKINLSKKNIDDILADRIFYLEKLIECSFDAKLSDCLLKKRENYSMTEIHKINLRSLKKACQCSSPE